jgi:hypothetical protein
VAEVGHIAGNDVGVLEMPRMKRRTTRQTLPLAMSPAALKRIFAEELRQYAVLRRREPLAAGVAVETVPDAHILERARANRLAAIGSAAGRSPGMFD